MQKSNLLRNVCRILKYQKGIPKPCRCYAAVQNLTPFPALTEQRINSHLNFVRNVHLNGTKCWNCGADRKLPTQLICDSCNVVQKPHNSENYFKVLDVVEDFDVDQKLLTTKYRKLQTILHPDKFGNKSDAEKAISADYSALVNKAYNTLQAPLSRALHMLRLQGENIEEDQKVTDPAFLMTIMELNEEVEEASSPEQLRKLNERNKLVLQEIGKEISKYMGENSVEKAKDCIIKMKYYNSVNMHINGLLRERGIVD